ncbi:MAG: hypothetical protein ACLPYS_12265 [Vulcanimicrobiaceae bacterium]
MIVYADSSALVKLYVSEDRSAEVLALAQRPDVSFAFNGLHDLEVRNAIRLLAFRGAMKPQAQALALAALDADLATDLYLPQHVDFGRLTRAGERLSAATTAHIGARALDLLHVAAAQDGRFDSFLTFDACQREVARVAGLAFQLSP